MFTVSVLVLFCIWVWFGYYLLRHFKMQALARRGVIEVVVSDGDAYVEGVLRSLETILATAPYIAVVVYCYSGYDLSIQIIERLYLRKPWFIYHVLEQDEKLLASIQDFRNSEMKEIFRIELNANSNPKEAIRKARSWIQG